MALKLQAESSHKSSGGASFAGGGGNIYAPDELTKEQAFSNAFRTALGAQNGQSIIDLAKDTYSGASLSGVWDSVNSLVKQGVDAVKNVFKKEDQQITSGSSGTGAYSPVVSNSAAGVNSGTIEGNNVFGDWQSLLDRIQGVSEANTAKSIELAQAQNAWQEQQNQKAMDFNAAEAAKNRDWQQMMSNTAHQREIADLQAAGLNPVLSASGGNGAAVTSGATASGVTSSGAKGEVDQGYVQSLMNFMASTIHAKAQVESSLISARAVQAAASTAAGASIYNADKSFDASTYGYNHMSLNQMVNGIISAAMSAAVKYA